MNLYIDPNWTFKQTVSHLKALKNQYNGVLASFSYFQLREVVEFKKQIRDSFYSLNFETWRIDKIWEYMNGFEYLYVLEKIAEKSK